MHIYKFLFLEETLKSNLGLLKPFFLSHIYNIKQVIMYDCT